MTTDLVKLQLEKSNLEICIRNFPEQDNGKITDFETWLWACLAHHPTPEQDKREDEEGQEPRAKQA